MGIMGPYNFRLTSGGDTKPGETDTLMDDLRWLKRYRKDHPEVIITYPSQTRSHLWEVSKPDAAALAFDSVKGMRRVLDVPPPPE